MENHYDVVIVGGGLAGLSLARQLLLETEKSILLLERRETLPPPRQKVGEATVQLSGYYFSKVLDLEEHLLREHYMKYNLRFFWKTAGRDNRGYEDYAQSYIRPLSNVASYQLDRNKLEAELLRLNRAEERFAFAAAVRQLEISLGDGTHHTLAFDRGGEAARVTAEWVVDATGRNKVLARRLELGRESPIRHGSYFFWVEGLVNVEKLTARTAREIRINRDRGALGHLPIWLATNHFTGEGFWLWVIPLQGKTSFGLVFDHDKVPRERVSSPEKLVAWICEEFPLFARDLPQRRLFDFAGFRSFAYDCAQTIHPGKWALSGEAGRFSDPLYSPGGDLIAIHNTLIADAIAGDGELEDKCRLYEQVMRALYQAYVPSYTVSYHTLGDQEVFSLRYVWELAIYFAVYVFPFINDLLTDRRFLIGFLRQFSRLGTVNRSLQGFLGDYYNWKKESVEPPESPIFFDFMEVGFLCHAEKTFYQVGVDVGEAKRILGRQLDNLMELARFTAAHVASVVLGDPAVLTNRRFVEALDVDALVFDPEAMRRRWEECRGDGEPYSWSFDPAVMDRFRTARRRERQPVAEVA